MASIVSYELPTRPSGRLSHPPTTHCDRVRSGSPSFGVVTGTVLIAAVDALTPDPDPSLYVSGQKRRHSPAWRPTVSESDGITNHQLIERLSFRFG